MRISDWSSDVCSSDLAFPDTQRVREENEIESGLFSGLGEIDEMRGVGRSVECDARMMPRGDVMTCRLQKQAQVHRTFVIGLHSAFLRQRLERRRVAPGIHFKRAIRRWRSIAGAGPNRRGAE